MPKENTNALRSSYKVFLDSPAGKDFVQHLIELEMYAQSQGKKAETVDAKAFEMVKIGVLYDLRTYIDDMSKPAPSPQIRSFRG